MEIITQLNKISDACGTDTSDATTSGDILCVKMPYINSEKVFLQNETGAKYSDPVDIVPCPYTYEETDELTENENE